MIAPFEEGSQGCVHALCHLHHHCHQQRKRERKRKKCLSFFSIKTSATNLVTGMKMSLERKKIKNCYALFTPVHVPYNQAKKSNSPCAWKFCVLEKNLLFRKKKKTSLFEKGFDLRRSTFEEKEKESFCGELVAAVRIIISF